MQDTLKNIALIILSVVAALALLEGLSRLAWPVQYGHKSFDLEGRPVFPADGERGLKPSLHYLQITQEFEKPATHTARGFRGPAGSHMDPARPAVLFTGDSMTYGIGLADEETFPYLYCKAKGLNCVNLGRPGSSTLVQMDMLEDRLGRDGWRPSRVYAVMNVMTSALFGGNDLTDNVQDARRREAGAEAKKAPAASQNPGLWQRVVAQRKKILEHSNLARLGYYIFGPGLRARFSPSFTQAQMEEAMAVTKQQLDRLDALSRRYGFSYTVVLVHPMQDLINGTWEKTLADMKAIAPRGNVLSTAPALMDGGRPARFYYPLDGHVTPEGARKIADYLVKNL